VGLAVTVYYSDMPLVRHQKVTFTSRSMAEGGVAAARPPHQTSAPGKAAQQATQVLTTLRQRLDLVALARDRDERFDVRDLDPTPLDVTPLVGVSRKTLLDRLGATSVNCRITPVLGPTGQPGRIAPCQLADDLVYSFYVLPKGWGGGGTELLLQFDGGETCTRARWFRTQ
jgi:hypothetical protein